MAKLAVREQRGVLASDEADEHCFYMTQHIATLPYRAPELLFSLPEHSTAVDLWAVGCILAEMLLRRELFPGRSVRQQIKLVVLSLGTPPSSMLDEVGCEKTRAYIHSFGTQPALPWEDIVRLRPASRGGGDAGEESREETEALDLIAKLMRMDPNERIDVHEAIYHSFLRPYVPVIPVERGCPFKVGGGGGDKVEESGF